MHEELTFKLRALGTCAIAAMLTGCAGSPPPAGAPGLVQQSSVHPNAIVQSNGARNAISGWTPADLQSAYNLPALTKGNGQIVAVVVAYNNPNVAADLNEYRSTFGLPKAYFTKYNQQGATGNYPQGNSGWGVEIDLSVEMVSASCPKCTIDLVEANSAGASDIEAAETEAVTLGARIVGDGFSGSGLDSSYFDTPGVEYLAAGTTAGDEPAAFVSVVAVGGTVLSKGSNKRGWSESVWAGRLCDRRDQARVATLYVVL